MTARRDDPVEQQVIEALTRAGVEFDVLDCDPAFADTAAFCERYGIAPDVSANAIVVASKKEPKQFVTCVVLATTRLDVNGVVRKRMGVNKASFASPEDTMALTGMMIGGVTPFALPPGLPVWVDARVVRRERVVVGGGSRSMKVFVDSRVFELLDGFEVVEGLANEPPTTSPTLTQENPPS
ncbi:MAG TPA: YbaK/EbsC family protein [Acidimicrobiales bacterium]